VLWAVGGVVAFCGALTYCELSAALPRSGGEYNFLSAIYHPSLGFAAGFVSVAIGFSAPIALVAMALGKYLSVVIPEVPPQVISYAAILGLAVVHAIAVHASGIFQIVVTTLKVGLILGFLALGFSKGNPAQANFLPGPDSFSLIFSPAFAVALMFVLYSYTGWNAVTYILGEVHDVPKTVPRAILLATGFVAILYVALNALFLQSAPMADYANHIEVARIAATALFGDVGGRIMGALVGGGLIASLSAMTWAGPRVSQSIGRDFPALRFLNRTSPQGVPHRALALQTGLALLFLASATYEAVLIYAQFALVTCSFLTVFGIFVLRWRQPGLQRPFRCPGFPFPPLIFLAVAAFALLHTAVVKPMEALAGAVTLLLGWLLYFPASAKK
jgi:APA family basic amino acid/polyamine antiporter